MENRFVSACECCPYHRARRRTHSCSRRAVGFWFQPGRCGVQRGLELYRLARELGELLKCRQA